MLNQLSWTAYLEIVILLVAIYYLFVLFRYYRKDALQLLQNKQEANETAAAKVPEVLRYEPAAPPEEIDYPAPEAIKEDTPDNFDDPEFADAERFIAEIRTCIKKVSGKPYSPAILIPQIKNLFSQNPALKDSPQRALINELIVRECEDTGTALLTEDEVDQWWTD